MEAGHMTSAPDSETSEHNQIALAPPVPSTHDSDRKIFLSPEMLQALGSRALNDDAWEEAEARLLVASRPVN
jgi:hypothetical protein